MILNPIHAAEEQSRAPLPVWQTVERKQKQAAHEWLLVAQPDHAALAGDLAARISSPFLPERDDEIIQGITLHDEGWAALDREPLMDAAGRPKSFLDFLPSAFVIAWRESIERAEKVAPIAGLIVSGHFCRLGQNRMKAAIDTPSDTQILREFLIREGERQRRLESMQGRSAEQIRALVDLLQFCDVLSLYLCCGSRASVDFPQEFAGQSISLLRRGEMCVFTPPMFDDGVSLAVRAQRFPGGQAVSIPFLLS
jgi:hypothetical protein